MRKVSVTCSMSDDRESFDSDAESCAKSVCGDLVSYLESSDWVLNAELSLVMTAFQVQRDQENAGIVLTGKLNEQDSKIRSWVGVGDGICRKLNWWVSCSKNVTPIISQT